MEGQVVDNQIVRLKEYQKRNRYKVDEIATMLDISSNYLYKLYNGDRSLTSELSEKVLSIVGPETLKEERGKYEVMRKITQEDTSVESREISGETTENEEYVNSHGNRFYKVDGEVIVEAPLLLFEAYARYLEDVVEAKVYEAERMVPFVVDSYDKAFHLAFKVYGDSMNGGNVHDTPNKSIILGREVARGEWLDGGLKPDRYGSYGWVLLTDKNIFFKDITAVDKSKGTIICHSRNPSPEYADFELNFSEIYQIFKVVKRAF